MPWCEDAVQPSWPASARLLQPLAHGQGETQPGMFQKGEASQEPGSHVTDRVLQENEWQS